MKMDKKCLYIQQYMSTMVVLLADSGLHLEHGTLNQLVSVKIVKIITTVLNLIQRMKKKIISILKNVCSSGKGRQYIKVMRIRKMLISSVLSINPTLHNLLLPPPLFFTLSLSPYSGVPCCLSYWNLTTVSRRKPLVIHPSPPVYSSPTANSTDTVKVQYHSLSLSLSLSILIVFSSLFFCLVVQRP